MRGGGAPVSQDTGIGLLFVGMLSLGVITISRSQSFAVDLTGFLFGDVLAVREGDLASLAVALVVTVAVSVPGHRSFVRIASKKILRTPPRKKNAARTVVEIDANRAYVNDIAAKKVHEIDYNDELRTARSFSLGFAPTHMVETGR